MRVFLMNTKEKRIIPNTACYLVKVCVRVVITNGDTCLSVLSELLNPNTGSLHSLFFHLIFYNKLALSSDESSTVKHLCNSYTVQ